MESGDEDFAKAVRAASIALSAKKKFEKAAKEVLDLARKELKRKGKLIDACKAECRKKTMRNYFQSSRGEVGGQPLHLVFDTSLPDVPGAELEGLEYPIDFEELPVLANTHNTSMSVNTQVTPGSSSASGDTVILSAKSPLITISEDSEESGNEKLVEVGGDSDTGSDDSDF